MAQLWSICLSSGRDPGVPRLSPASGSLHGACLSLCLCLCLSLCLSQEYINTILESGKEHYYFMPEQQK